MARYIEANDLVRAMTLQANRTALGEIAPPHLSYMEMLEIIADAPTADVAPKSEVALKVIAEFKAMLKSRMMKLGIFPVALKNALDYTEKELTKKYEVDN